MSALALVHSRDEIEYPISDGQPMAETDTLREQMSDLIFALQVFFCDDPRVYVSGNLLMYYVEGDPRKSVAPDVSVVKGIAKRDHRSYKVWEEGKGPDVVIELTSASTRLERLGSNKGLSAALQVKEYFLFDPLGEYLKPPLRGYRLIGEEFAPLIGAPMISQILGLELRVASGRLRLYDLETGRKLLTPSEIARAHQSAEAEIAQLKKRLK